MSDKKKPKLAVGGKSVRTKNSLAPEAALGAEISSRNDVLLVFGREGLTLATEPIPNLMRDEAIASKKIQDFCRKKSALTVFGLPLPVRAGWLYVRAKYPNGPSWREYEIQPDGTLLEVIWEESLKGKDVRPSTQNAVYVVKMHYTDTIHVAYSPVQWTWKRYQELENDKDARENRMQPVELLDLTKESEFNLFNEQIQGAAGKNRQRLIKFIRNKYGIRYACCVALKDPMGFGDDLCWVLDQLHLEMNVLVTSLRTGLSPDKVRSGMDTPLPRAAELHRIALSCYLLGFADSDAKDDLGKKMDQPIIEALLGVNVRRELRQLVESVRATLISHLTIKWYQSTLLDFCNNTPLHTLTGKEAIAMHCHWACRSPNADDHMLDLPETKAEQEKLKSYMVDMLEGKNNAGKVWQETVWLEQEDVAKVDVGAKVALASTALIEAYVSLRLIRDVKTVEFIFNRISTIGMGDTGEMFIKMMSWAYGSVPDGYRQVHQSVEPPTSKYFVASTACEKCPGKVKYVVIPGEEMRVRKIFLDEDVLAKWLAPYERSIFNRTLKPALEVLNLFLALHDFTDKEKSTPRNVLNLLGAIVSSMDTYQVLRAKSGRVLQGTSKVSAVVSKVATKALSKVALGFDAVVAGMDAYAALQTEDYDAFACYGVATSAFAASVFLTGGWALVAWAVGLGAVILGSIFTDTPLESFAKLGPLRKWDAEKERPESIIGLPPHEAMTQVIQLVESSWPKIKPRWRDLNVACLDLMDIIYGCKITVLREDRPIGRTKASPLWSHGAVTVLSKLRVRYKLSAWLPYTSEFELFMRLYFGAMGGTDYEDLHPEISVDDNGQILGVYELSEMLQDRIGKSDYAEVVLFSRVGNTTSDAIPFSRTDADRRYFGYRMEAYMINGIADRNDRVREQVSLTKRVGTVEELTNPKTWETR